MEHMPIRLFVPSGIFSGKRYGKKVAEDGKKFGSRKILRVTYWNQIFFLGGFRPTSKDWRNFGKTSHFPKCLGHSGTT